MSSDTLAIVGVDIGGTNVKVGIVTLHGDLLAKSSCTCPADPQERTAETIVATLVRALSAALEQSHYSKDAVLGVGVACPGQLVADGVIHGASAFPTWHDVPLKAMIAHALNVPVTVCNDADAAIIAEQWVGSAKQNVTNFIMITLGTGIGCGLIVDGKLVHGATNFIEGGHMLVEKNGRPCNCSQYGCLEAYCSATALVKEARTQLDAGASSELSTYPRDEIAAKLLFDLAASGDRLCKQVIEEAADYLGFALVSFCRILDPELIVLAGGVAEAGDVFLTQVRAAYQKYTWTSFPNPVRIEKATVGYDSGIIGAAAVAKDAHV